MKHTKTCYIIHSLKCTSSESCSHEYIKSDACTFSAVSVHAPSDESVEVHWLSWNFNIQHVLHVTARSNSSEHVRLIPFMVGRWKKKLLLIGIPCLYKENNQEREMNKVYVRVMCLARESVSRIS